MQRKTSREITNVYGEDIDSRVGLIMVDATKTMEEDGRRCSEGTWVDGSSRNSGVADLGKTSMVR